MRGPDALKAFSPPRILFNHRGQTRGQTRTGLIRWVCTFCKQ